MGYVYVIRARGTIHCKIGATNGSVDARLQKLQTGNPYALEVVRAYRVQDAFRVEHALHRYFSFCRGNGEWFELSSPVVVDVVVARLGHKRPLWSTLTAVNASRLIKELFVMALNAVVFGNKRPKPKRPKLGKTYH